MITDEVELYEVLGVKFVGTLAPKRWLEVENCRTLLYQRFRERDVDQRFRLIRAAPSHRLLPPPVEPST